MIETLDPHQVEKVLEGPRPPERSPVGHLPRPPVQFHVGVVRRLHLGQVRRPQCGDVDAGVKDRVMRRRRELRRGEPRPGRNPSRVRRRSAHRRSVHAGPRSAPSERRGRRGPVSARVIPRGRTVGRALTGRVPRVVMMHVQHGPRRSFDRRRRPSPPRREYGGALGANVVGIVGDEVASQYRFVDVDVNLDPFGGEGRGTEGFDGVGQPEEDAEVMSVGDGDGNVRRAAVVIAAAFAVDVREELFRDPPGQRGKERVLLGERTPSSEQSRQVSGLVHGSHGTQPVERFGVRRGEGLEPSQELAVRPPPEIVAFFCVGVGVVPPEKRRSRPHPRERPQRRPPGIRVNVEGGLHAVPTARAEEPLNEGTGDGGPLDVDAFIGEEGIEARVPPFQFRVAVRVGLVVLQGLGEEGVIFGIVIGEAPRHGHPHPPDAQRGDAGKFVVEVEVRYPKGVERLDRFGDGLGFGEVRVQVRLGVPHGAGGRAGVEGGEAHPRRDAVGRRHLDGTGASDVEVILEGQPRAEVDPVRHGQRRRTGDGGRREDGGAPDAEVGTGRGRGSGGRAVSAEGERGGEDGDGRDGQDGGLDPSIISGRDDRTVVQTIFVVRRLDGRVSHRLLLAHLRFDAFISTASGWTRLGSSKL
mmetsp:Transcript_15903/g.45729  ORF Transcript_15903/g.45729 Transcript_15903/m.45729 type:complete len:640 (-) Transcript_15903:102-2021(-)